MKLLWSGDKRGLKIEWVPLQRNGGLENPSHECISTRYFVRLVNQIVPAPKTIIQEHRTVHTYCCYAMRVANAYMEANPIALWIQTVSQLQVQVRPAFPIWTVCTRYVGYRRL